MSTQFHATYVDGVLKLDTPLLVPEQTRVTGLVTGVEMPSDQQKTRQSNDLSDEDFDRLLDELALDVPPLPAEFSRADIYLDHD